jgi:phosphate-selective porin
MAQAVKLLTTIPAYYDFLQTAFSAATGNVTIHGRTTTLTENLTTDKAYQFILKGGFNADFTSQTGATTLQGKLTIGKGSLVEQGVTILITRNTKDYRKPAITVCTPQEFLKSLPRS